MDLFEHFRTDQRAGPPRQPLSSEKLSVKMEGDSEKRDMSREGSGFDEVVTPVQLYVDFLSDPL